MGIPCGREIDSVVNGILIALLSVLISTNMFGFFELMKHKGGGKYLCDFPSSVLTPSFHVIAQ